MSFLETLLNYLDQVQAKDTSQGYTPHPLIKALSLALRTARKEKEDGNYAGSSGDEDLTPDGKPRLAFTVIVEKKGDQFALIDVQEYTTGEKITPEMAEKIVHSEILIDRYRTDNIPNKEAEAIMTDSLGFNLRIMQDKDEIEKALKHAQKQLKENMIPGIKWQVKEEIMRQKDASNWPDLFYESRALVGGLWARETGNGLVITSLEDSVPKWQMREWIFRFLDFKKSS